MTNDVVIVFEVPAADLTVAEEFQRARLSRKLRIAAESRELRAELLTLVVKSEPALELFDEPSFERPWPKGCNTCAGQAWRVEGEFCAECGLPRAEDKAS